MSSNKISLFLGVILCLLMITSCKLTERIGSTVNPDTIQDGVYEGEADGGINFAKVRVTIESHQIAEIKILEHGAMKGKKAEKPVIERIIEKQSTDVDAVTGATNSSIVLMNAVQKAIEKAKKMS